MSLDNLSTDDKQKITDFVDSAVSVMTDIATLKEGLTDTAKALAEELGVKHTLLMKAARVAAKASLTDEKDAVDTIEVILEAAGRG